MKNYFENYFENYFKKLHYSNLDFVFSTAPCGAVTGYFNSMANSYEDELDKLAYVELIKKTIENMANYLPTKINKKIYKSIHQENDLDKLAGYYKLSKELVDNSYEVTDLWEDFLNKEDIHRLDDLWKQLDIDLKTNGVGANLYLVSDLLQMDKNIEWVKLNAYERADEIRNIKFELWNYIADVDLEDYISSYDKDDFIEEFKLVKKLKEEELEKEKLEAKDEKTKALVM
ncbi:hypothetical protein FCL67_00110 [Mycoplasma bovis]|nr:hypothetical protein [Mycoplasmopsis bovis]